MKNQSYSYLVTIDVAATLRGTPSGAGSSAGPDPKYKRQLRALFNFTEHCHRDSCVYAMTKEQFALFLYLRCRSMAPNPMRELNMKRIPNTATCGWDVDLRRQAVTNGDEVGAVAECSSDLVTLASQLTKVNTLLADLESGGVIHYDGLTLNTEHMVQVLVRQRADLRTQLIAAAGTTKNTHKE